MVENAESAIIQNKFALGVFLDIQGAFNKVSVDATIKGMQDKNFPEVFINWYRSYLKYKTVTINHEGVKVKRFLTCITPQGGVLSPLAWYIAFESLLQVFSKGQVMICGKSVGGPFPGLVARKYFLLRYLLVRWCPVRGLAAILILNTPTISNGCFVAPVSPSYRGPVRRCSC